MCENYNICEASGQLVKKNCVAVASFDIGLPETSRTLFSLTCSSYSLSSALPVVLCADVEVEFGFRYDPNHRVWYSFQGLVLLPCGSLDISGSRWMTAFCPFFDQEIFGQIIRILVI